MFPTTAVFIAIIHHYVFLCQLPSLFPRISNNDFAGERIRSILWILSSSRQKCAVLFLRVQQFFQICGGSWDPRITTLRGPFQRKFTPAAQPNRDRARRPWLNTTFDLKEASLVLHIILRPECTHDFEHLYITRPAVVETDIIQLKFRRAITNRSSEDCPSTGNHIQHRRVLGCPDWMIKGQDNDVSAKQDARGSGRNTGECH